MKIKPIPFHLDVNKGLAEAKGLIHIQNNSLILEYEVQDVFGGFLKSDLKEIKIPFDEIVTLTYDKGFWGAKVKIEGNSMKTFDNVPGSEQAGTTLKIKRKDRTQAEQSISSARVLLSEYKLHKLDEDEE